MYQLSYYCESCKSSIYFTQSRCWKGGARNFPNGGLTILIGGLEYCLQGTITVQKYSALLEELLAFEQEH